MTERDPDEPSTTRATSPYDEPTGQIPLTRSSSDDRDDFYNRHARRSPSDLSPVDDLDDLDPDDVATRPVAVPAQTPTPEATSENPPEIVAAKSPTPEPAEDLAAEPTAIIDRSTRTPAPLPIPESDDETRHLTPTTTPIEEHAQGYDDSHGDLPAAGYVPTDDLAPDHDEIVGSSTRRRHAEELEEALAKSRRGTLDLGLLVLRVAVGGIALVHGLQKLFGWWNGPRLSGFEAMLVDNGFNADFGKTLAIVGALSETVGGLMLILGLLTPIGASAILGTMLSAAGVKTSLAGGAWFFAAQNGVEYELFLAVAAAVVILAGPGLYSLDFPRGWARRPFLGSVLWLLIGVGAAVVVWVVFNGSNPLQPTPH